MVTRTVRSYLASFVVVTLLVVAPEAAGQDRLLVLTNHLGYETNGPKRAVVRAADADRVTRFAVREYGSDREVLTGSPKKVGRVARWRDWSFWTIDFDEVAAEGEYYIECASERGAVRSFPFLIRKDVLERHALSDVVFYLKGQRSSGLLDRADARLSFHGSADRTVDLHGGWFDASGDYGKHLSHLSFSTYFNPQQIPLVVWSLFKSYERLEGRQNANFAQYKRRLLDEAIHGADYLVRARNPAGSFFRSVSAPGPGKRPEDRRVGADPRGMQIKKGVADPSAIAATSGTVDERTYEVSYRSGGGVAIAALALASACGATGDFTSAQYLDAAVGAFANLERRNVDLTNDGKENIVDEYCALSAATELYRATKQPRYKTAAAARAESLMRRLATDGRYRDYWRADDGDRPFFHASDAGLPVVSLLAYLEVADAAERPRLRDAVRKALTFELDVTNEVSNPFGYCRQLVQNKSGVRRSSFFFPHDTEAAPWWQGENARLASIAVASRLAARQFEQDEAFAGRLRAHARNQLNWILGLNPFDACMLQGTGRNNPPYMFFDSYQYANAPGGICNGITSGFSDEDGIDFNLTVAQTGADNDWRWGEQWLPHAAWFLLAVSIGE
jgi:hypothetical protein